MTRPAAFLLPLLALARGSVLDGFLKESDIPQTGEEWISLSEESEFLPAATPSNPALREAQRRFLAYGDGFADGSTYYDEYSQAWRVLGWYIDCSSSQNKRRKLEEAAQQGGDGDDANANVNENLSCMRYLLWAAVSGVHCSVDNCWFSVPVPLIPFDLLLSCSTSIWTTKGVASENTSSTIVLTTNGIPVLARRRVADVPKWTAT